MGWVSDLESWGPPTFYNLLVYKNIKNYIILMTDLCVVYLFSREKCQDIILGWKQQLWWYRLRLYNLGMLGGYKLIHSVSSLSVKNVQPSTTRSSPQSLTCSVYYYTPIRTIIVLDEMYFLVVEDGGRGSVSCAVSPRLSLNLRPHHRSSSGDCKGTKRLWMNT